MLMLVLDVEICNFRFHLVQVAKSQYVLLWCWAAAVGAGLLKSDDLIMSAARLRCSNDVHYETENLELLMDDAKKVLQIFYAYS